MKYIAFLRGINVGGNKKVPMIDLKKSLESFDLTDVKTLLNSGNVVFETQEKEASLITQQIQQKLEKDFGFKIPVIIRTSEELQFLVATDPFRNITITPETRLYVTFSSEETKGNLKIPYESSEKDFGILQVSNANICSFLILSPKRGTIDLMRFIEKEFGKKVTTRNWNTVVKLASL
jgi:uncharacterized protein (DUF1697 family)